MRQFLLTKGDSNQKLINISSCNKKYVIAENVFPTSVILHVSLTYLFKLFYKNPFNISTCLLLDVKRGSLGKTVR